MSKQRFYEAWLISWKQISGFVCKEIESARFYGWLLRNSFIYTLTQQLRSSWKLRPRYRRLFWENRSAESRYIQVSCHKKITAKYSCGDPQVQFGKSRFNQSWEIQREEALIQAVLNWKPFWVYVCVCVFFFQEDRHWKRDRFYGCCFEYRFTQQLKYSWKF